jgi:cytochrome c-type biogenesis protein CcmH/NrfF
MNVWVLSLLLAAPTAQPEVPSSVKTPEVTAVVGPPAGESYTAEALRKATEKLAGRIRCPVCQGSNVADSPSQMARNMKAQVSDLLAKGFADEQVLDYFQASYGEFIRLEPTATGVNLVVWVAPLIALFLGILALVLRLRGGRTTTSTEVARDHLPGDHELDQWVRAVRTEAYPEESPNG